MNGRFRLLVAVVAVGFALAAGAGELSAFNEAVARAWKPYRSAMFYLRTENAAVAAFELEQMVDAWTELGARFRERPPDAFAGEPRWRQILDEVGDRARRALRAAEDGRGKDARTMLAPIRDLLGGLRARSGVRVFSDCIAEVNAAMAKLYTYRRRPPARNHRAEINELKSSAAVLRYLLRRCAAEAPDAVRSDPSFQSLVDGAIGSVATLFDALDAGDTTAVVNLIRELASFDRMLFLRYG